MIASPELVKKVAEAIAVAEGYGKPGPTQQANNPGNLARGDVGCGCIQTGGPHGALITKYANAAEGWTALTNQVGMMLNGKSHVYSINMSIAEVAQKWCGDPNWAFNVARCLEVNPLTTLAELIAKDFKSQWPDG
jgi:hypothetical protein